MTKSKANNSEREVMQIVQGQLTNDGAGVRLRRIIGTSELSQLDPFLLFDEFHSDNADDYIAGFPNHPHRGFETVTYMLAGRMRHEDNQGNSGLLTAGSVQWMTAGRGIVHSEMPEQENGLLWGFQLWVNLPARDKMTAPRYQDIAPEAIPEVKVKEGVWVKVIAGEVDSIKGPITAVATQPIYLDIKLQPKTTYKLDLPINHNAFVYVYGGAAQISAQAKLVTQGELAVLGTGGLVTLAATDADPVQLLLVAGQPLREPVARYGPFVMNTKDEIRAAMEDFQAGRL
ncbi:pirin [Candidatus Nitrosoglobus terrae]|uniref:Pirin n=1 Tax=Candidatus Nitrosoglobus terrae TaxID=1630141 RepID=A0A1Q2SNF1_9GAMM|nr:pirin family protein [Candidatus Nitrosoglobus terrae]BAW80629.1 pirin [Candidatus Nitrosoglobus terrae]